MLKDIALIFDTCATNISNIVNNKIWRKDD
jgi:hypothetical protein